jgi:hypothetical protein
MTLIKGIVVEKGFPASDGTIMPVSGAEITPGEIPVMLNFKQMVGFGKVYKMKSEILMDMEIDLEGFQVLYPAISFKQIVRTRRKVSKYIIMSVSLNGYPNHDVTIRRIGDQMKDNG